MKNENITIIINHKEASDLYKDVLNIEVELDEELAAMFRLTIEMEQRNDGSWKYLDDERFTAWTTISIQAGFENSLDDLIDGYITHVRPFFDTDLSKCKLEIWGMDKSVAMDREEMLKNWPNKNDSDIAREVFKEYGFNVNNVKDTSVVHDEAISTIIQRETDMQFLKRLALRNGYECYVEGDEAYFGPPLLDDKHPQPDLAVNSGNDTNLNTISIEVDALRPTNIAAAQIERMNKQTIDVVIEETDKKLLGPSGQGALLKNGIKPAKIHTAKNVTTGNAEMASICRGLFDEASWFVTAEGEVDANAYGHVLKPRKTVAIKGIGETYSGVFYVSHVTHSFATGGYTQFFKAKRNALKPAKNKNMASKDVDKDKFTWDRSPVIAGKGFGEQHES